MRGADLRARARWSWGRSGWPWDRRKEIPSSRFRGAGMNKTDESFKDFVLDQLQELAGVEARRMFGGFGLYRDEIFFGIVHRVRLYFKTDISTVGAYRKSVVSQRYLNKFNWFCGLMES